MAHGYGFTDESVCNFLAYLTCIQSELPLVRYSAELAYWRYLARAYRGFFPQKWKTRYSDLDIHLRNDLVEINEHVSRYKNLMPQARDKIYDKYLKSHGLAAGIASYDQIVDLVAAYNKSNPGQ